MDQSTIMWMGVAFFYLIALAVRDLRRKNYAWAAASAMLAAATLLLPMQTHTVTIDLPAGE